MSPETAHAVDAINALKIYEANGETELGRLIISSRAGATKIEVKNNTEVKTPPTE